MTSTLNSYLAVAVLTAAYWRQHFITSLLITVPHLISRQSLLLELYLLPPATLTQNTNSQGRHFFLPSAQTCWQASLPKFWSPKCRLHLALLQVRPPSPQPGVPEEALQVWESGCRVPQNLWRNDSATRFWLVPSILQSKSEQHQIKLSAAGLERSKKRHLLPKEVITLPHSLLQDVKLKFPLSPKEGNPRIVTKHEETASVSGSLCVENEWRGGELRASFVYACPALPWPLSGTGRWDPVGSCTDLLMEGMASSSPQNSPHCKTANKRPTNHLLSGL